MILRPALTEFVPEKRRAYLFSFMTVFSLGVQRSQALFSRDDFNALSPVCEHFEVTCGSLHTDDLHLMIPVCGRMRSSIEL